MEVPVLLIFHILEVPPAWLAFLVFLPQRFLFVSPPTRQRYTCHTCLLSFLFLQLYIIHSINIHKYEMQLLVLYMKLHNKSSILIIDNPMCFWKQVSSKVDGN